MNTISKTLIASLFVLSTQAHANDNPIIDNVDKAKDFAISNKVTQFVVGEYNKTKEFQIQSWQEGKDQLGRNKEQIVGIFANVKDAFTHYFVKEGK